ncbi:hypothetical protein Lpar_1842 [Legionella parisiensis]|uniref:Uncharacterized protein n=2 Tax=Legionella parisiensis TaxID=45071 RepID=A0A1E5JM06_9GAMM|nr:hypothetical protein Lpar_1842 [Legionella parisiensis]OEH45534.1 hypothetical protein lpari_03493 [Legionella parisiensis]STX72244.1 Uncharacterised protein [Legionella parisiensis]
MQFTQEEQNILYKHSNLLGKMGLLGMTDTEASIQHITKEVSKGYTPLCPIYSLSL